METNFLQSSLPQTLAETISGYAWQQSLTGCSASKVFRLERAGYSSLYLKIARRTDSDLAEEKQRLEWLRGKLPVPEVCFSAQTDESDYLLVSAIEGAAASDKLFKTAAKATIAELAKGLKMIHDLPVADCGFHARLETKIAEARRNLERGLVDESDFDQERLGRTAASLFQELLETKPDAQDLVFTHGDYCLPNVILNHWRISGFIDWGRAGIADCYQDIALLARSIESNFGAEWLPFLFEALEIKPDKRKIRFYQLLDEFF